MKINKKGLEAYPLSTVIFGNVMMLLWIGVGAVSCYLVYPLAAWIYIAFSVVMVYGVLRKVVCMNCYYYGKRCALGWGKISALFFKQGAIGNFPASLGVKIAAPTYGLLTLTPLVLIIFSLIQGFSINKVGLLVLLLLITVYSGFIGRKKACSNCKMKFICPGSTDKT